MPDLSVAEVLKDELAFLWPLVRTSMPELSLQRWQEYGRALIRRGGTIFAVVAPDGNFHGLATCEIVDQLRLGRVVRIETFVTFELTRGAPVRQCLYEALERFARRAGCAAITVSIPSRAYVLEMERRTAGLREIGQQLDQILYLGKFSARPASAAPA